MSRIVTRFAPSPTGYLHLGHVCAAKVAHDLASQHAGEFLLRFEDIDHTRVREHFYGAIEDDLRWLGLDWSKPPIRQSTRNDAYTAALTCLQELGVVYPCFCTRREIEHEISQMARAPHGPEGALYPGICRRLSADERANRIETGAKPAWRLDVGKAMQITGNLTFSDQIHGDVSVVPDLLGDVVLARKDIGTSYHLAVVTDDAFQQITHVTRGEDLLPSTHVHRILQQLLGHREPVYLHHPLILDEHGKRLAKRDESLSILHLRQRGLTQDEVLAKLSGPR